VQKQMQKDASSMTLSKRFEDTWSNELLPEVGSSEVYHLNRLQG
jgi:hypothetical protein